MAFDWFTFIAQIVNFILLLVLLRVFLYRPVLNIMDDREQRLTGKWAEADETRQKAEALSASLEQERAELASQRRARLDAVEQEAEDLLNRRLQEVDAETESHRQRQKAAFEQGRDTAVGRLRDRSARLLVAELRTSLGDLADSSLERQTVAVFASRLESLPETRLEEFRTAARSDRPLITSAFEPDEAARQELTALLKRVLATDWEPEYTTSKDLLFGIELTVGALRLVVSGSQRLESLETAFGEALSEINALNGTGEPRGTG